jgi:transcriptional regulator with XRE-family HTH domain
VPDYRDEDSLGRRIQAARKARGIRTTKALSEAIGQGNVSEATLQNIETGRLTNLSLAQLLNIAFALKVAPSFLLAPLGRPSASLDLVGLSDGLASMNAAEFDAWLCGSNSGAYRPTNASEISERSELEAFRILESLLRERRRLNSVRELERDDVHEGDHHTVLERDRTTKRLADIADEINSTAAYLDSAGWRLNEWTAS